MSITTDIIKGTAKVIVNRCNTIKELAIEKLNDEG